MSVCQVLDSKKSIRAKSLVKFSDFNISEAKSVLTEIPDDKEANLTPELEELLSVLNSDDLLTKCESPEDKNLLFYVAGFTARSISNQVKCDDCNDLDTSRTNSFQLSCERIWDEDETTQRRKLLEQVK